MTSTDTFGNLATLPRLVALDVARGLMLVVSVSVNAWFDAPTWFEHAPWLGVHPVDLVFPTFVTLSGAGLAMAYARRIRPAREARRVIVLLLAGLAYNALHQYLGTGELSWSTLRFTGVLQLYAAIVLGMALMSLIVRRWWHWLALAAALTAAQVTWLATWTAGCPGWTLTKACNPSGAIDPAVFGATHIYAGGALGHDPEGLVALIGALITATAGAAAGRIALDHRNGATLTHVLRDGAALLVSCAVIGSASSAVLPAFKRLWTAPFAWMVATGVIAVFLLLHLALDTRRAGRWESGARYPLVALGRNSLLVYFGSHAVMNVLTSTGPSGGPAVDGASWAMTWRGALATSLPALPPAATFAAVAVVAWLAIALVLHRYAIYIKA